MLKIMIGLLALFAAQPSNSVEICHLANEGFLIKGKKESVLFDALIAKSQHGYPAMKSENVEKMINGEAPFDDIAVSLTSHHHTDHFQADVLAKHATNNRETTYFMSSEARSDLSKVVDDKTILSRVDSNTPTVSNSPIKAKVNGIEIEKYRISHGNDTENLGYKVIMDGVSFFHTGDMVVADIEELNQAGIEQVDVDYLLVPFWFGLNDEKLRAAINQAWDYNHIVLMHLEAGESRWMQPYGGRKGLSKAMKKIWPNVILADEEMKCFESE